jgi:hypothetical protein
MDFCSSEIPFGNLWGFSVKCLKGIFAVDFMEEVNHAQQSVTLFLIVTYFDKRHVFFVYFTRCLLRDERQRWSAEQLLEHRFLKAPVEHGLSPQRSAEESQVDSSPLFRGICLM